MSVSTTGTLARSEADTQFSVFQNFNIINTTFSHVGGFFSLAMALKFTNHNIPKGATITAASMTVVAATTNFSSAGFEIGAAAHGPTAAWQPDSFGDAWRTSHWYRFKAFVRDPGGTTIINTITGGGNSSFPILFQKEANKRLGQSFIPPTSTTLGSINMRLQRVGNPTGSMVMEITKDSIDGTVLATSNTVLNSTISNFFFDVTFTFSGANQIALDGGATYFAILRPVTPYTVNGTDYINWRGQNAFFSLGGSNFFGTGSDFDQQNYPLHVDVYFGVTGAAGVGTPVPWTPPLFFAGNQVTTPSLASLIQSVVDQDDYQPGAPIALRISRAAGSPGGSRQIASFDHPSFAAPRLFVTYEPPPASKQISHVIESRLSEVDEARNQTVQASPEDAIVDEGRSVNVKENRSVDSDC